MPETPLLLLMREQKGNDKPANVVITYKVDHKGRSKVELYMTSAADDDENKEDE